MRTDALIESLTLVAEGDEPGPEHVAAVREALDLLCAGAAILRPEDLFGPAQAAEYLGVNRTTVSRWKREGVMPEPWQDLGSAGTWTLWTRDTLDAFKAQRLAAERQPAADAA